MDFELPDVEVFTDEDNGEVFSNWTLEKEFRFEASHQLIHHDGKCARLHGHSWIGRVIIVGSKLIEAGPKTNMVVDYGDISKVVKGMVETYLDHHHLNTTLNSDSPTSEFIARWIHGYLRDRLEGLVAVQIEETCTSKCTYSPLVPVRMKVS